MIREHIGLLFVLSRVTILLMCYYQIIHHIDMSEALFKDFLSERCWSLATIPQVRIFSPLLCCHLFAIPTTGHLIMTHQAVPQC